VGEKRKKRSQVFISYSHQDRHWLERLQVHLKPLARVHKIEVWDDTLMQPGSKWQQKIEEVLNAALVAVLLVSADFLASDFIAHDELPPLLKAAEEEGAIILPVILSPCWFKKTESLYQFQAVNPPDKPLINVSKGEQEAVFVQVAEAIEAAFAARMMHSELQYVHERLDDVLQKVAKLFISTMSGPMYENLRKLTQPEGFGKYEWNGGLERELYHLRDIGYIEVPSIQALSSKEGANLSDFVKVTKTGREFVELREAMSNLLNS
jgi:hypothetical protein